MNDYEGLHEDCGDCPEVDELELFDGDDDYEDRHYEEDQDYLLAQQELEDFEQADEYYGHYYDEEDGFNNFEDAPW